MRKITGPPTFRCTSDAPPSMAVFKMRWNSSMPPNYQHGVHNYKYEMAMTNDPALRDHSLFRQVPPQPLDDGRQLLQNVIHLFRRVVNAQAEADAAAGAGSVEAHRQEDMRRVQRAGRAGRAAGSAHIRLIEQHQDAFGFDPIKGDVARVGQSRLFGAVARTAGN